MMKHRWCKTINNIVCYYQTPFNIAVIIEQMSNYNNVLREQENIEKDAYVIKINNSSKEKTHKSIMSATAKNMHHVCRTIQI